MPFMKLASLQAEFAAALVRADEDAPRWIAGPLARAVYPVVARLVGDDFFDHAAARYAVAHPSASGDIHGFGARFGDFLAGLDGAAGLAYLPDTARLEWCLHESFHAGDRDALDARRLAAVDADAYGRLLFELHPSVRLLASSHPVRRLWEIHQPAYDGPFEVDFDAPGERLLIARRAGFEVVVEAVSAGEHVLFEAVQAGSGLGDALARALAAEPGFDLGGSLGARVQDGTLIDFRLPDA
jgi:Putative DNA-binding domain